MQDGLEDDLKGELHHHSSDGAANHDQSRGRLDHLRDRASLKHEPASNSDDRNQYSAKGTLIHSAPIRCVGRRMFALGRVCRDRRTQTLDSFADTGRLVLESLAVQPACPLDLMSFYRHVGGSFPFAQAAAP